MENLEARLRARAPLWGRWNIGACIYRSSQCAVYALYAGRCGEKQACALKVQALTGTGSVLEEKLAAALEEIRVMERLRDCGNIVTLYDDEVFPVEDDLGERIGYDVLIRMERLSCLAEQMREGEILPPDEVRRLGLDLCHALKAAHTSGVMHRDIKPANIYRTPSGVYQLGDFGVAKRMPAHPILETMAGTAAYMAPEVARGEAYDCRADLYSLGIVLYQLLNDNFLPLTDERTSFGQREQVLRSRWNGSKLPRPKTGDGKLWRVIRRCCEAAPDRRYADVEVLLETLQGTAESRAWKQAAAVGWCCAVVATAALLALPPLLSRNEPEPLHVWAELDPSQEGDEPEDIQGIKEPAADTLEEPTATYRYTVVQAQMTWDDARVYCESRGGHLATVLNQEQFDTIAALLEEQEIYTAWLGASNFSASGGFQWVTGDPFPFAAWAIGEPNNENQDEHYLMMYVKGGEGWVWNDSTERGMWSFEAKHCGFVCQWDDVDG